MIIATPIYIQKQNQEVFLDSHVRFFEELGGSWKEVVYDNMRNVVSKFQSGGVKVINEACINLALYYNFEVISTNVRSGHEKVSIETLCKELKLSYIKSNATTHLTRAKHTGVDFETLLQELLLEERSHRRNNGIKQ